MHVKRLHLENIRSFEDLELVFEPLGASALLIGDNNAGKSTVLRSLGMGLCDQSSAAALFRELPGEYVRRNTGDMGKITVELSDGDDQYEVITEIHALKSFERVEQTVCKLEGKKRQKLTQDSFPWERIFATGYGAGLRVEGTADFDYYLTADAVYPIFKYDAPLQNPELIIRRIIDKYRSQGKKQAKRDVLQDLKILLNKILQLRPENSVELRSTGIHITGDWGETELSALGDGYRATLTWVLDVIGWWFVKREQEHWIGGDQLDEATDPADVKGIVLIDEVEQHLHPRWQRTIMQLLIDSFPNLQFIATSHSPLVASGCENIAVHRWESGEHRIDTPFGWLAEDVYRMMGLESSRAETFQEQVLERFKDLELKRLKGKASKKELAELQQLRHRFEELPGADPLLKREELASIRSILKTLGKNPDVVSE